MPAAPLPSDEQDEEVDDTDIVIPESKPAPTPSPKPTAQHSAVVLSLANEYGFTDAEIAELDPAALERVVLATHRRENARARSKAPAVAPPAPAPEPEPELDWGEVEEIDDAGVKKKRKVSADDYDPGLAKIIKDLAKENRALKKAVEEDRTTRTRQAVFEKIDDAIAALDDEETYGAGGGSDLDNESDEFVRRIALINASRVDWSKNPSASAVKSAFKKAHAVLRGKKAAADAEERPNPYAAATNGHIKPTKKGPTPEEWAEAGLARPTARASKPAPKSEDAAKAATRAALIERGLPVDDPALSREQREILDSLPN